MLGGVRGSNVEIGRGKGEIGRGKVKRVTGLQSAMLNNSNGV